MFKVKNRNTKTRYKIFSKSTIKAREKHHWRRTDVFIVKFEHTSHLVLAFLRTNLYCNELLTEKD